MAYSTVSAPASAGILARVGGFAAAALRAWKLRREYRLTVDALRSMSDRELDDIGLTRCAIPGAAREHVYGK